MKYSARHSKMKVMEDELNLHRAYQGFNIVIDNAPVPVAYILKLLCGFEGIYLKDTYGIFFSPAKL